MSAAGQSTAAQDACATWMPRKKTHCARGAGHPPPCKSPKAMERQRQRAAEQRPARVVAPETRARWNKTHKFARFGITEAQFNQMLEAQGYACAICRTAFLGQRIYVDHDHACCPVPASGHARSCGTCVRGLLCVGCNTQLGWLEAYDSQVRDYLAGPAGSSSLVA